jgi:hypothetical protein
MSILRSILDRAVSRLFKHDQYESRWLRHYFERVHQTKVGLYSTGFFDRWRVNPGTVVGRYCSMGASSRIISANHPVEKFSTHPFFYLPEFGFVEKKPDSPRRQIIEDDVWIGHGVIITPGCKVIGRGSVIGAGAIVTKDVPRYAIVGGTPAQLIRYRFAPEIIEAIEATKWWLLDKEELQDALRDCPEFLESLSLESARTFLRRTPRHEPASSRVDIAGPKASVDQSAAAQGS